MSEQVEIENEKELEQLKAELRDEMPEMVGQDVQIEAEPMPKGEFMGAEACSGLCASMFDMIAARKGEHWKLAEEESGQMGAALDRVLAKYIPKGLDKYNDETALLVISLGILMPRMNAENVESEGVEHGKA